MNLAVLARALLPVLAALLAVAACVPAAAATPAERRLFTDTLAAARQGRLADRQSALRRLQQYPLYDYIGAADLRHQMNAGADARLDDEIERFVRAHPDLPPAQRLRRSWLADLAQRSRWRTLLDNSRDDDGRAARCRMVNARLQLGDDARTAALALWRVGRSQPDACDPVFAWLAEHGLLTAAEIRGRARLAVIAGHYGLARYLARKLPDNPAATIQRWIAISQTPSKLANAGALDGDVAVHAFKRLALRDHERAADLLPVLAKRLGLDAEQRFEMKRYVALLYAQNHQPEALIWFARIDHARLADDAHALGWEIRAAIYQQRWPLVVEAIRALPPALARDEEWRYWQARALAEMGRNEAAEALYRPLAAKRSYHGYLAADDLGQSYQLNERPLPADTAARARVEAKPALARARELRALGMQRAASREWRELTDGLDKPALAAAARIAYQWQWYARAITTLARADYWDDLDIRYPLRYADSARRYADINNLDPAWIMAIMRTESLFQPKVRSPAGAIGLMQLLPGTARGVARRIGAAQPSSASLTRPQVNIRLGSRYLADMAARWQGNIALATASYNAGPRRIERWLPERPMDPAIWIANIPYTETRHYVQRAMSHMTVFQQRLDEHIVPLNQRIGTVAPSYADIASSN